MHFDHTTCTLVHSKCYHMLALGQPTMCHSQVPPALSMCVHAGIQYLNSGFIPCRLYQNHSIPSESQLPNGS